jgi:hypothetical protein
MNLIKKIVTSRFFLYTVFGTYYLAFKYFFGFEAAVMSGIGCIIGELTFIALKK